MHQSPDPDAPLTVAAPGPGCTFTLVNAPPAPFPTAGTPQPPAPPHVFCRTAVYPAPGLWKCVRCGTTTMAPDGCNLGCPGAPAARTPDPPPPRSVAEAWAHCRATLERLAAGDEGVYVPDALAAVEALTAAERDRCCRAVCPHCRAGVALLPKEPVAVLWCHADDYGSPCLASEIRNMPAGAS